MFTKSAQFYDAIYAAIGKDYAAEAVRLHDLIQTHTRSGGNALLDLACGTGAHLAELRRWYDVEGLDLDPQMLAIAAQRVPGVPLHQGDLADFSLPRSFDAVICLFSSIGYVKTDVRLKQALRTMARHTVSGGIVIVEPWILPDRWETGHVGAVFVDEPKLKIARINTSERRDTLTTLEFHYLVGTPDQVVYFYGTSRVGALHPRAVSRRLPRRGVRAQPRRGRLDGPRAVLRRPSYLGPFPFPFPPPLLLCSLE